MSLTRFSVLKDDRRVILGVDKDEIFEDGMVYEAVKILDEIVIRPLGKYAIGESISICAKSTVNDILPTAMHIRTVKEVFGNQKCNKKSYEK